MSAQSNANYPSERAGNQRTQDATAAAGTARDGSHGYQDLPLTPESQSNYGNDDNQLTKKGTDAYGSTV